MNIAFYAPAWPAATAQNGISTYVDNISRALEELGHCCFIFAPSGAIAAPSDRVVAVDGAYLTLADRIETKVRVALGDDAMAYWRRGAVALARALRRFERTTPLDIVEIEETAGIGAAVQDAVRAPVVTRLHGPWTFVGNGDKSRAGRARVRAEGRWIARADAVSSPSRGVLTAILERHAPGRAHAAVIPNPIALQPENARWSIDRCDPNLLLFVGRFDNVKGADIALATFERVLRSRPAMRLVMAGEDAGVVDDAGASLNFDAYAAAKISADARRSVSFVGRISRAEVDELRLKCLAQLSTSRFECFPYAVTEALAAGCPVIATRTLGVSEGLADGREILLADVGDAPGLADHVDRLAGDRALAANIAAAGNAACQRLLSPSAIARKTETFYKSVISG